MSFTHQKRPYRANCIQFTKDTLSSILALFDNSESLRDGEYILIRTLKGITCLQKGDWIVTGENGESKFYTDGTFKIKYKEI